MNESSEYVKVTEDEAGKKDQWQVGRAGEIQEGCSKANPYTDP